MEHPDPKKHQLISFFKSGIRIGACASVFIGAGIAGLAAGLLVAELIGVYEELV